MPERTSEFVCALKGEPMMWSTTIYNPRVVRESKPSFSHLSNEKVRPHHLKCLEINEENFPDEKERAEELRISKILSYEPNDGEFQSRDHRTIDRYFDSRTSFWFLISFQASSSSTNGILAS